MRRLFCFMGKIQTHSLTLAAFLITLAGALLFSTKAIIVKKAFANTDVTPVTLLAFRMLFSLPFYLLAAFLISSRRSNVHFNAKQWAYIISLGLLGYYLSSLFDFLGLQYISAGLERLILFLYPTFAVLLNGLLFKQRLQVAQRWALALTYLGIAVAFIGELQLDMGSAAFYTGCLLVLLCAITYSFYLVGSSRLIAQTGANKFTAYAMLTACFGVFVHFAISEPLTNLSAGKEVWQYGILLAVVATVVPSFLLSMGLKKAGANNVAIISSIGPVSTIIQAHYFLGEPIFFAQLTGTGLVIGGVLMLGWRGKEG